MASAARPHSQIGGASPGFSTSTSKLGGKTAYLSRFTSYSFSSNRSIHREKEPVRCRTSGFRPIPATANGRCGLIQTSKQANKEGKVQTNHTYSNQSDE